MAFREAANPHKIAVKVRIEPQMWARLEMAAKARRRTVNAEIVWRLDRSLLADELKDAIHPAYHEVIDEIVEGAWRNVDDALS